MIRRTSWHYYHCDADRKAEQVADWMAGILGWSNSEKELQLQRYKKFGNPEFANGAPANRMALAPK